MATDIDNSDIDEQKQLKKSLHFKKIIAFNLLLIVVNLVFLLISSHELDIIRGDGPVGFEEMVIKGSIFIFSVGLLTFDFIILAVAIYRKKQGTFAIVMKAFIFIVLAFFAVIAIESACSNSVGYCQNGKIIIPKN